MSTKPLAYSLSDVRGLLDRLKMAGLDSRAIAAALELHQVHCNARSVRHWYSGRTNVRNCEYRALRDLLREIS